MACPALDFGLGAGQSCGARLFVAFDASGFFSPANSGVAHRQKLLFKKTITMQKPFTLSAHLLKRRLMAALVTLLFGAVVMFYWRLSHKQKITMSNVGGKTNACTCSQRLDQ